MRVTESHVVQSASRSYQMFYGSHIEFRVEYPVQENAGIPAPKLAESQRKPAVDPFSQLEKKGRSIEYYMVMQLIEALFSRTAAPATAKKSTSSDGQDDCDKADATEAAAPTVAGTGAKLPKVTAVFSQICEETESACYRTSGTVKTADGREIAFRSELDLSRAHRDEVTASASNTGAGLAAAMLVDPLVLNYGVGSVALSEHRFDFDLDADGDKESISQLGSGSAYLALDANKDGRINDGGELFGVKSGDGFADLAGYDADRNGWIDEGDAVYATLKLWVKDDTGKDELVGLKKMNVGAIWLGQALADFSLNDADNRQRGLLRASGVYLSEDGRAGSIQQVDLAA